MDFRIQELTPATRFDSERSLLQMIADLAGAPASLDAAPLIFFTVPLCFVYDRLQLVEEVSRYLAHVALHGNSLNGDTVRTYAKSLLPWLAYLKDRGIGFADVEEKHFAAFRASAVRQTNWSSSTINLRIQVPALFHLWGQESQTCPSAFGRYLVDRSNHNTPDARRRLAPTIEHRQPRFVELDEWFKIRATAANPWRLMFSWAICTGLRRSEICALRLKDLDALLEDIRPGTVVVCTTIRRKGGKSRALYAPVGLIRQTIWWRDLERPSGSGRHPHDAVFLSARGKPIVPNYLSRVFRTAAERVGVKGTLHHLRHTFALMALDSLQEILTPSRAINPQKILQELLAHANQSTSEIYLRARRGYESAVAEHLGEVLID